MLTSGQLVVPLSWYRYASGGEVHGEGYNVDLSADVSWSFKSLESLTARVTDPMNTIFAEQVILHTDSKQGYISDLKLTFQL